MGKDYYVFNDGRIKRSENTVRFEDSLDNKKSIPIENIERLHLFGEIDLNTKFINFISKYGVIVNFYNYYGFYSGSYYPRKKNVSGLLLVKQGQCYVDYSKRIKLAKDFIESAAHHILRNLRKHKEVPEEILSSIEKERENVKNSNAIDELMGSEGRMRHHYYNSFKYILKKDFNFTKREKRPPTDPVNALISFGNSLMYTAILGEMYQTVLDPTISYLHEPSTKRFSLVLDISEIFKPLVIDSIIFSMINNRKLINEDFNETEGICYLSEIGRKKFIKEFETKMCTTIKHRALNRSVSYRTLIKLECYKLIKHILGDQEYKPLKAWW